MSYETVGGGMGDKDWAKCHYVRYTLPEDRDLKENELRLKKDEAVEGFYLRSYQRDTAHGKKWNHVLVKDDNTHIVIPDNKDVTTIFLSDRIVKGAKTRFTYLGKVSFEYTDDKGKTGTAKAVKALVEQDRSDLVEFSGDEGCEKIGEAGTNAAPIIKAPESTITSDEIPF